MKIVVTGCRGQLGSELCRSWGTIAIGIDRSRCDVTDRRVVADLFRSIRPAAVVNCAAMTDVEGAESRAAECQAVNADAVATLAGECRDAGALLVQISTDYVFHGAAGRPPFCETDPPNPQSVYAATKLAGERAAESCPRRLIIRSCGLYGAAPNHSHASSSGNTSRNFVTTMLRLGASRSRVRVVNDQWCAPTSVTDLAAAIRFLVDSKQEGLFHVANRGATTWHGFATTIFQLAGMPVQVDAITTAEYGAAAPRPPYSVLDTAKYHSLGGPEMPPWEDALARFLERLA